MSIVDTFKCLPIICIEFIFLEESFSDYKLTLNAKNHRLSVFRYNDDIDGKTIPYTM